MRQRFFVTPELGLPQIAFNVRVELRICVEQAVFLDEIVQAIEARDQIDEIWVIRWDEVPVLKPMNLIERCI